MSDVPDRLREVMDLVGQAQNLLDLAVGRATRLSVRDRELARDYLLPPRNHLRSSAESLRRKMDTTDPSGRERRRGG